MVVAIKVMNNKNILESLRVLNQYESLDINIFNIQTFDFDLFEHKL